VVESLGMFSSRMKELPSMSNKRHPWVRCLKSPKPAFTRHEPIQLVPQTGIQAPGAWVPTVDLATIYYDCKVSGGQPLTALRSHVDKVKPAFRKAKVPWIPEATCKTADGLTSLRREASIERACIKFEHLKLYRLVICLAKS
jgi:hypothetical protein